MRSGGASIRATTLSTVTPCAGTGRRCRRWHRSWHGGVFLLPWPVRTRCFFAERFVLWPLEQVLDQTDRYCVCLTSKEEARVFLYYLGQVEELAAVFDEVPGKVRFPDPFGELEYQRKHVEGFHRHFQRVADALLR